jgi:hypothetical protein
MKTAVYRRSNMRAFLTMCVPVALIIAGVGCSNQRQLTPESAKKMIIGASDTKGKPFSVSYARLEPVVMASTLENYAEGQYPPGSAKQQIKDLIAGGYVSQSKEIKRIPIISGEYSGTYSEWNVTASFENVPDTDTIRGSFAQLHRPSQCHEGGQIGGVLGPDGSGLVEFVYTKGGGCFSRGEQASALLTKSDGTTFKGSCDGMWSDAAAGGVSGTMKCNLVFHSPNPPSNYTEATRFHYSFDNKFTALAAQPQQKLISAGSITVDIVQNLLLGPSETMASGEFQWHVEFNDPARIIEGKQTTQGLGHAEFGKQPDGNWVLVNYSLR